MATSMMLPAADPTGPVTPQPSLEEFEHEQRARVMRVFADPATDPKIAAIELHVWLGNRASACGLSMAEATCLDVMDLIGQVYNGGYEQWIDNGYYLRGDETCAALRALGLVRFSRLTEKALNAIPKRAYATGFMRLSARRQAYFNALDARFYRVLDEMKAGANTTSQRIVAYARRHGIVPLGPATPLHHGPMSMEG